MSMKRTSVWDGLREEILAHPGKRNNINLQHKCDLCQTRPPYQFPLSVGERDSAMPIKPPGPSPDTNRDRLNIQTAIGRSADKSGNLGMNSADQSVQCTCTRAQMFDRRPQSKPDDYVFYFVIQQKPISFVIQCTTDTVSLSNA